jgi:hypothetical protein
MVSMSKSVFVFCYFQSISRNPSEPIGASLVEMILGWSTTLYMIFVSFRISTWLLGQIMLTDWLKFEKSVNATACYRDSFFLIEAAMPVIIWYLNLQLPVQSVPITTKVVSSSSVHGEVYLIQHYVLKWPVTGRWFSPCTPPIKLTATM